ncbi:MFS transporter [Aquimarina sp. ERC-38]|uniref:MFS transporter n=1 Tax=Aquimarina sp. ERC-38 TaxID=2949996 RepID=UPI002246104E|nr:MFS transporter [Aquimarina sp. ERC-38]UZO80637.1 MFS transporter [Aquimarina sp. ERC-38]
MKKALIIMTLVAVVSDYLLHPFYPQFFEARFGVNDPKVVGYYFAAICFLVMLAFPFWAYVSKKISELNILIYTQCIAGILALYCFWTSSYTTFWIVSLIMIFFKGSYLLVYPYILKISSKNEHSQIIGILSVVVHLGGIAGAIIGGLTVDLIDASYIYLIMASGDFVQMGMSGYLLATKQQVPAVVTEKSNEILNSISKTKGFILKIGLVTMLLYFSDFLIRPFFATYWESVSIYDSKFISGTLYAIPGFIALMVLWWSTKRPSTISHNKTILSALSIGALGLLLQGIPSEVSILVGRVIYGWAIFQGVVKFDVLLFELSTPDSYATDYSKVHFFQNLGVLISSFFVGILVENQGLQIPFYIASVGFVLTLVIYYLFFKISIPITSLKKEQRSKKTALNS